MADPFARVMEEARRFLSAKGVKEDVGKLAPDEYALSFTIARSAGYDILGDVKKALQEAFEAREDFRGFQARIEPILRAKGWWGVQDVADPKTGEIKKVRLGSPHRLRTIFWANTRTAYAAGQWERAWRTRDALPYLVYVESTAAHKRPEHLQWVGTILPIDDPWWDTHYPPNAWGCMCRTRQASQSEADEAGYDPNEEAPDSPLEAHINTKTGETVYAPRGVHPDWAGNPGKTRFENAAKLLAEKLDEMSPAARKTAAADLAGSALARRVISGDVDYVRGLADPANAARGKFSVPVGALTPDLRAALEATSSVVRLSAADATKQFIKRRARDGELSVPAEKYPILQELIETGEAIRQTHAGNDVVLQGEVEGEWWYAALRRALSAPNEVYLKSFRRTSADKLAAPREKGVLIRKAAERGGEE